jgi:tryptophan-rich sensory protein
MNILKLLGCILISGSAGFIGAVFTARSVKTWYVELAKPSFNPPGWLFGPVWMVLYIMMGVALYIVWERATHQKVGVTSAVGFFIVQLVLNAAWSVIFFGQRQVFFALVDISLLWVSILMTMILFWRISHAAGMLLVPYLLWVSFAALLNFSIWQLNRGTL